MYSVLRSRWVQKTIRHSKGENKKKTNNIVMRSCDEFLTVAGLVLKKLQENVLDSHRVLA